ncbi:hypothetical protein EYB26_006235 [Talaromyces marneffei]|nr:uncharacterized protein EYB26_006235 [Talaromyces marneffei]QGA18550.1 hypothetical protein EYB26_006235 [Talaromyces marneffei]
MITNIGYKSYIVFAVINFVTIPVVYFCFPETSKLPLEAVDLLFANRDGQRPGIWRVVKDSTDPAFMENIKKELAERAEARTINEKIVDAAKQEKAVELENVSV